MTEDHLLKILKEIYGSHTEWKGMQFQRVQLLVQRIKNAEAERCAQICETEWSNNEERQAGQMFASLIRGGLKA